MTRSRIIAVALAAMFCLSAIGAASAFAAPKGEIVNKSGAAPVKNKFSGTSNKKGFLETVTGSKITCKETAVSGTIASKTTGSASFTFTGCESGGLKCKAGSETAGTVITPVTLTAAVVSSKDYILNTVNGTEETTAKAIDIKCSTIDIKVKGSLLIPATPENTLKTEFLFNATGSKGVQTPEVTENHLAANFSGAGYSNASLQAEELKVKFEEEVEFI
jgi:hypothetical protein